MATLLQDNFNRADSAAAVGSPQVGGPYSASAGTWGVNSGQLYLSTGVAGAFLLAPGASDVDFSAVCVLAFGGSTTAQSGIVVRAVDANNCIYIARVSTGTAAVFQNVAGAPTQISAEFTVVANDVMRFVCWKRYVWFYLNGQLKAHFEDMRYDPANATKVGFRSGVTATGRWDDALAVTQDVQPGNWGAAPEAFDGVDMNLAALMQTTPSLYKGRDSALADESEIP